MPDRTGAQVGRAAPDGSSPVEGRHEQRRAAGGVSIGGIAEAYARLRRLDWQQDMQEIQGCLAHYRAPADRIREVLSRAAAPYPDGARYFDAEVLRQLVDAGGDRIGRVRCGRSFGGGTGSRSVMPG